VEATCESSNKHDEIEISKQPQLCNNSPPPRSQQQQQQQHQIICTPTATMEEVPLVDDVKKLSIRTSDPDLSKFKTKSNSPLASSSNLSRPDASMENLRLCYNNENNSRKSELKWQCSVSLFA